METKKLTGLRKRQQIEKANKSMFLWIIGASVLVAFCLVASQFIFKQARFNAKVISAKTEARDTLKKNLQNADTLKKEVNQLIANPDLGAVKSRPDDSALQVVLDALPTDNDPTAFATSLQQAILPRSGVSLDTLSTVSSTSDATSESAAGVASSDQVPQIPFNIVLSGNYDQIKTSLQNMEHVIRPISISRFALQGSGDRLTMAADGMTYYLPSKSINVTTKPIKP
jgi:Tfp pilus assembly protein PilO